MYESDDDVFITFTYIYPTGRTRRITFFLFLRKQVSFLMLGLLLKGLMERKKKEEKLFNIYDIPLISFSCAMTAAGNSSVPEEQSSIFFHLSFIVIRSRCLAFYPPLISSPSYKHGIHI